ncbi:MAG: hypothetical protein AAB576_06425 [Elusimicrobiota bacterium]
MVAFLAPPAALLLLLTPALLQAASFDVATEYRMRALSYVNLNLNADIVNNHAFISQRARLGFALKDIQLGERKGEPQTMEVAVRLHAVGVAGSTTPFQPPFDRIADHYPNAAFVPFIENAYAKVRNLAGGNFDMTFGRQNVSLGSGLLLDDDGAGMTGISAAGGLPWLGMKGQAFILQAANRQAGANNLDVYGFSVDMPGEGIWQFNELIEKDRAARTLAVNGCAGGCPISRATRYFSSLRYQLHYGPMVFDGEAALERGSAEPAAPATDKIKFNGNAEVLRAKWKQPLWGQTPGIVRMSLARGSGDDTSTPFTDEAFFPSSGHRFDGLERSGFGEFFAATPYDAFGGQSTATATGLQAGASGIVIVGLGVTPPAYHGIVLDLDYYLFQAERNLGHHRTLGTETDLRLRYDAGDRFSIRASAALFTIGTASNPTQGAARRYMLEAFGRF